jgi:hypothetical protein
MDQPAPGLVSGAQLRFVRLVKKHWYAPFCFGLEELEVDIDFGSVIQYLSSFLIALDPTPLLKAVEIEFPVCRQLFEV